MADIMPGTRPTYGRIPRTSLQDHEVKYTNGKTPAWEDWQPAIAMKPQIIGEWEPFTRHDQHGLKNVNLLQNVRNHRIENNRYIYELSIKEAGAPEQEIMPVVYLGSHNMYGEWWWYCDIWYLREEINEELTRGSVIYMRMALTQRPDWSRRSMMRKYLYQWTRATNANDGRIPRTNLQDHEVKYTNGKTPAWEDWQPAIAMRPQNIGRWMRFNRADQHGLQSVDLRNDKGGYKAANERFIFELGYGKRGCDGTPIISQVVYLSCNELGTWWHNWQRDFIELTPEINEVLATGGLEIYMRTAITQRPSQSRKLMLRKYHYKWNQETRLTPRPQIADTEVMNPNGDNLNWQEWLPVIRADDAEQQDGGEWIDRPNNQRGYENIELYSDSEEFIYELGYKTPQEQIRQVAYLGSYQSTEGWANDLNHLQVEINALEQGFVLYMRIAITQKPVQCKKAMLCWYEYDWN